MDYKKDNRIRRSASTRLKQKELGVTRVSIFRSNKHFYAQIISPDSKVLASVSSLQKEYRDKVKGNNIASANFLGENLAKKAKDIGIKRLSYDRSGFRYHGKVKAFADAIRNNGIEI
jgi:large subunit ribosomal protein L18